MNEKEMLMKQLRANAFPHNNGKVMQAINIIRHSYYSLHNHPSNGILSPEDIQQLIKHPQMQGIGAVGNAGALFTCEKVFGYSQKNAEGWFKALKKKYPLYKGESGKIEDALAQRIAFAEELRRDGAKYGLVFSR